MKNKLALITLVLSATLSLTGCDFIMQFFDSEYQGGFFPIGGESAQIPPRISDVPTPPPGDTNANKASYIYGDLIDNSIYPMSCTPSLGKAKLLVIPVWFTNSNTYIAESKRNAVRQDIENAYFGDETSTGWRSVKTYYEEESLGSLTIEGTVSEWYDCGQSLSYYAKDPANEESGAPKTTELVKKATDWYFTNHSSDSRKNYDQDGDGYLDGVILIYAAPDYDALGNDNYDNLWAFCFWIQDTSVQRPANPGVNVFFWASYDFIYGSDNALNRSGSRYHSGDTAHCILDTHTYIHEMGHMFGLEDYYDYSSYKYQPAGAFSMQDHNIGSHDPFSSFALGWGKAYVPIETTTIDLKPFSTSGEMIILSPSWNIYNSPFDEYIILEYFTPQGLNQLDCTYKYMLTSGKDYPIGPVEYGIRVWHVDARLLYTTTGEWSASKITTNPKYSPGRVAIMMSNTYAGGGADSYISVLGAGYANYNLLQMIRNNISTTYKPAKNDFFNSNSLFKANDTFSMSRYANQFVNGKKLNNNSELGFSFTVNACNNNYASISITKL